MRQNWKQLIVPASFFCAEGVRLGPNFHKLHFWIGTFLLIQKIKQLCLQKNCCNNKPFRMISDRDSNPKINNNAVSSELVTD